MLQLTSNVGRGFDTTNRTMLKVWRWGSYLLITGTPRMQFFALAFHRIEIGNATRERAKAKAIFWGNENMGKLAKTGRFQSVCCPANGLNGSGSAVADARRCRPV